jgi:hypothetical protein
MDQDKNEVTEPLKPCRLPLSALQKPNTHVRRVVLRFRRQLESAVLSRGALGVAEASKIHTACIALRQVARIDRILAEAGEPGAVAITEKAEGNSKAIRQRGLTHTEWLAYSDRLLRAKETVDRALASLGLDKSEAKDVWDAVYRQSPILARPGRQETDSVESEVPEQAASRDGS